MINPLNIWNVDIHISDNLMSGVVKVETKKNKMPLIHFTPVLLFCLKLGLSIVLPTRVSNKW